jgi:hypothetical protein
VVFETVVIRCELADHDDDGNHKQRQEEIAYRNSHDYPPRFLALLSFVPLQKL